MRHHRKLEGIVIRRNNVGEADRIVTLLTPEGKLAVVARGIRKLTSRKRGALELFQVVDLVLSETSGLPVVQEATTKQIFRRLRTDFQAASFAYWAAELVDRLLTDDGGGSLYQFFLAYLERVEGEAQPLDLRSFELAVLTEVGSLPELHQCVVCHEPAVPDQLGWSAALGGIVSHTCLDDTVTDRRIAPDVVKVLRLLAKQGFGASQLIQASPSTLQDVQEVLHHYLEYIAERRFQSLELMTPSIGSS